MSLVGRTLANRYEMIALLGKGGMGEVYEAQQKDLKRRVAVKVLASSAEADVLRFKQEALAAAGLAHPNIVQIFDFVEGDPPLLVMELLRGRSLAALVKQSKLDPARAVSIMTQVLSALAAAHDARIVHRDVKPENIFVCESNLPYDLVKVLDFGLARPLDDDRRLAKTRVGVAMGTPAYMAPEQARGEAPDVRMDFFAAGVTLYYALSGRRPFEGKTTSELLRAVKRQPPIPLDAIAPHLDLDLVRIVERSLSKDPATRFSSARAFLEALTPLWPANRDEARAPVAPPANATQRSARSTSAQGTKPSRPTAPEKKRAGLVIGAFEALAPPITASMIQVATFARDGLSALAVGPAGLARWTIDEGWSARELPPKTYPGDVRAIAFGPSGEAVLATTHGAFVRARGAYAPIELPADFVADGAHVDHASHVLFAGTIGRDGVVVDCAPTGTTVHVIGSSLAMHAVTRASSGAIVACGARGTVCSIASSRVFAHAAGKSALRAIAQFGAGFACVGERGALVAVSSLDALATATEATLATEDLVSVSTRARFVGACGARVHVSAVGEINRTASAALDATSARVVYLDNGVVRVIADNAAVLEATISAGP